MRILRSLRFVPPIIIGKTANFWWACIKRAARGGSAFANNWQWLVGFPALAAIISLGWLGEGAVSLNTNTALGALEAAGAAFIITLVVGFFIRLFSSASNFYYEEKERADELQQQIDLVISPRAEAKAILHQCHMEICNLFIESVSQAGVSKYIDRVYETLGEQAICIEDKVGTMARTKFLDHIAIDSVIFRRAAGNTEYNNILMILERTKNNLEELIKSEIWNHMPIQAPKGK